MSNTQYTITVNGEQAATKSKKDAAVTTAEALFAEHDSEARVAVITAAGTEVHVIEAKTKQVHVKPWTREADNKLGIEVPEGYTVAYTRNRIGAVVARANDASGWIVVTKDGKVREAKDTVEAREITNGLAEKFAQKQAAAKEKEAAEKAAAKEAKATARAQKLAADEKAKADRKLAREQAKKDKLAAQEAAKAAKAEPAPAAA